MWFFIIFFCDITCPYLQIHVSTQEKSANNIKITKERKPFFSFKLKIYSRGSLFLTAASHNQSALKVKTFSYWNASILGLMSSFSNPLFPIEAKWDVINALWLFWYQEYFEGGIPELSSLKYWSCTPVSHFITKGENRHIFFICISLELLIVILMLSIYIWNTDHR